MWERVFESGGANSICPASSYGYVVVGFTSSYGAGGDVYLIKIDENGYAPPIEGKVNLSNHGDTHHERSPYEKFPKPESRLKRR